MATSVAKRHEQNVNKKHEQLMNGGDVMENGNARDSLSSETAVIDDDGGVWGFPLVELYKLALRFHKEKEGKALHLSYDEKTQLVARSQHVLHGPARCAEIAAPQVGYLDVIGRDRRRAWEALGDASKEEAMSSYVNILDAACRLFRPYVEAHKRDLEERERLIRENEVRIQRQAEEDQEHKRAEEETRHLKDLEVRRLELQRQQIQEALNQQTCYQFKAYAEQQFPNDAEQQCSLIRQLQEQHYQQYVQQVYEQQQLDRQQKSLVAVEGSTVTRPGSADNVLKCLTDEENDDARIVRVEEESNCSSRSRTPDLSAVKPASMWTRKDIVEFKRSVTGEEGCGDSVIKVGHGETVTVRVPTHEDGTCLFWEFATDGYDIGFGVFFEWTETPDMQVSVHVSDSEDDDDDDDDDDDEDEGSGGGGENGVKNGDVERGHAGLLSPAMTDVAEHSPPLTVIIPIYRRDCHEEVYAGSHVYPPGQGVYLLKFDNSYSLWRSKTLYYRVYYTH